MANIIQNFSDKLINLTQDGVDYDVFDEKNGDFIRLTILDTFGTVHYTFYSDLTWDNEQVFFDADGNPWKDALMTSEALEWSELQLPIYRDQDNRVYVKPNEAMDKATDLELKTFNKGKWTLKFDFIRSIKLNSSLSFANSDGIVGSDLSFYIGEISPTRKEVRLVGRQYVDEENQNDEIDFGYASFVDDFLSSFGDPDADTYKLNLFLSVPESKNIPIINYQFDSESDDITSLVCKLHNPLPTVVTNYQEIDVIKEIFPTQYEEIRYFDEQIVDVNVNYLSPSTDPQGDWGVQVYQQDNSNPNYIQSYNDLIHSASMSHGNKSSILYKLFSGSKYKSLNINYDKFENHSFFGSAEYKLRNFYQKISTIESHSLNLSQSMNNPMFGFITASADVAKRKQIFADIENIVSNFTPYEHWMYNDFSSSNAYPNAGKNYIKSPPLSGSFSGSTNDISTDAQILGDYYGMDIVYKVDTSDSHEYVTSGSMPNLGVIYDIWDTGSEFDGHNTASNDGGWYFDANRAFFSGSSPTNNVLIQNIFTSSNGSTTEQFIASPTTYKIEFDVPDLYQAGEIRFDFGIGAGASQRKSFSISSTGHQKELLVLSSLVAAPNNKLGIRALSGFSGSIDNVSIIRTTDADGRADIFTDSYKADNPVFGHYDGRWYLSFWAKWQELPIWENSNVSGSNPIPVNAFAGSYLNSPDFNYNAPDKDKFYHYVLAASQSYWRFPDDPTKQADALTQGEALDTGFGWEILSGSNITGSYIMEDLKLAEEYSTLHAYNGRSILPSGELFRLYHITSSQDNAPVTESFFTDVRLWREDSFGKNNFGGSYTASLYDVVPFSNFFSTGSTIVEDWYERQLYSASLYDRENINALYNNIPAYIKNYDNDRLLERYLSVMGEQFDIIKNYIDNWLFLNSRSYEKYESVPDNLLRLVGEHFGWTFMDTNALKSLLDYVVGSYGDDPFGEFTNSIWKNILNNLIHIYKTKGTPESIRSFINSFGIPPNVITVAELGSSNVPQAQQSPGVFNMVGGNSLRNSTGSLSYSETIEPFYFLNTNEDNHSFRVAYNSDGTGHVDTFEMMFTTNKANNQILFESSGSQHYFEFGLVQCPESSSGMMHAYLSSSVLGSPAMSFNDVINETAWPMTSSMDNQKIFHIGFSKYQDTKINYFMGHKPSPRQNNNVNPTLDDKILYFDSGSMMGTHTALSNFTASLTEESQSLVVAPNLTGSVANITCYNGAPHGYAGSSGTSEVYYNMMTSESFAIHIYNPNSVARSTTTDLPVYRYDFKGLQNEISASAIIRNSYPQTTYESNFDEVLSPTFTNPNVSRKYVTVFRLNARGVSDYNTHSTKNIYIGEKHIFTGDKIEPYKQNTFVRDVEGENRIFRNNKISLFRSPVDSINNMISDLVSDRDLSYTLSLSGPNADKSLNHYPQLKELSNKIFDVINRDIVDTNQWIRRNEQLVPPEIFDYISRLLPVDVDVSPGIIISSHKLHRNRHVWGRQNGGMLVGPSTGFYLEQTNKLNLAYNLEDSEFVNMTYTNDSINKFLIKETSTISDLFESNRILKQKLKLKVSNLIPDFATSQALKYDMGMSGQFSVPFTLTDNMTRAGEAGENYTTFSVKNNFSLYTNFLLQMINSRVNKDILSEILSEINRINAGKIDLVDELTAVESLLFTSFFQELYSSEALNMTDYTLKGRLIDLSEYVSSYENIDVLNVGLFKKILGELLDKYNVNTISKNKLLNAMIQSGVKLFDSGLVSNSVDFTTLLNVHGDWVYAGIRDTGDSMKLLTDTISRRDLTRILSDFIKQVNSQLSIKVTDKIIFTSAFLTLFVSEITGIINKDLNVKLTVDMMDQFNLGLSKQSTKISKSKLFEMFSTIVKMLTMNTIDFAEVLNMSADKTTDGESQLIDTSDIYSFLGSFVDTFILLDTIDKAEILNAWRSDTSFYAEYVYMNLSQLITTDEIYNNSLGYNYKTGHFAGFVASEMIKNMISTAFAKTPDYEASKVPMIGEKPHYVHDKNGHHYVANSEISSSTLYGVINVNDNIWFGQFDRGELDGKLRDWKAPIGQYLNPNHWHAHAKDIIIPTAGAYNDALRLHVTTTGGGQGSALHLYKKNGLSGTPGSNEIWYNANPAVGPSYMTSSIIENCKLAINGTTDTSKVKYGSGVDTGSAGECLGVKGMEIIDGTSAYPNRLSVGATLNSIPATNYIIINIVGTSLLDTTKMNGNNLHEGDFGEYHIYNPHLEAARDEGWNPYRYDVDTFGYHFKSFTASPTSSYAYNSYPLVKVIEDTERWTGQPKFWHDRKWATSDNNYRYTRRWRKFYGTTGSDMPYDAADPNQFMNRNRDYTPGVNYGKLMGTTVQIQIDADGNITYPPGHILKTNDFVFTNKAITGTINDGQNKPYDPIGRVHKDNHPNYGATAVYAWDVNGTPLKNTRR